MGTVQSGNSKEAKAKWGAVEDGQEWATAVKIMDFTVNEPGRHSEL